MVYLTMLNEDDFSSYLAVKRGISASTIHCYLSCVRTYLRYAGDRPITLRLTEEYLYSLQRQRYKNHSINTKMGGIVAYNKYLQDRGNPVDFSSGFRALKVERIVVDIITVAEIKRALTTTLLTPSGRIAKTHRNYIFFTEMLAYTGARFSEMADLTPQYVYEDHVYVTETKGFNARKLYLPPELSKRLKRYCMSKKADERIFTTRTGARIHANDYLMYLRALFKQVGIAKRVYPHVFRHSFATQLARDGARAEEIKEILGHKDIATTLHYVHLADDSIKKAVFKHSLLREQVDPKFILADFKRMLASFQFDADARFFLRLQETESSLSLDIHAK